MPRIPRLLLQGESATYHLMSHTALPGFVLGEGEKDYLLGLVLKLSRVYFVEVLGFCLMGTHFHLVVRMHTGEGVFDDDLRARFRLYHGESSKRVLLDGQLPALRAKWASLSEFVKDLKQRFSRWYNRANDRRGYFWGERFKSVLVEDGDTLINCLAYIDLNPVRAGLVNRPEDYRWSSLGYHLQTTNRDDFLSLDFGLRSFAHTNDAERLRIYRKFVYEVGAIPGAHGAAISEETFQAEEARDFAITTRHRFACRCRYFTDSGVIGSRRFVAECYTRFERHFACRHPKKPQPITGLEGVFSLKRLRTAT